MKKLLIVYPRMTIGGSTTSLLGLLSILDYKKVDVDLLLYKKEGELINNLPKEINILQQACKYNSIKEEHINKILHPKTLIRKLYSRNIAKKSAYTKVESQLMCYENARLSRPLKTTYDVAIGFLEGWSSICVSNYVKATKKVVWVHCDYLSAGFDPRYDYGMYTNVDSIVTVSERCLDNLKIAFPSLSGKMINIGNISDINDITKKSTERIELKISNDFINLVTVCRLDMSTKGLDRIIQFVRKCVYESNLRVRLYLIGGGPDESKVKEMITNNRVDENIFLLGERRNPFPYMKAMDAFLLLSRYEGKPMVITEAQVLQLPAFVTEYASSREQIIDGQNGYILPNDDEESINRLIELLKGGAVSTLKRNIILAGFSFENDIEKISNLIY